MIKLLFTLMIGYRLVAQYEFPLRAMDPARPDSSVKEKAFGYWLGTGEGDLPFGPNGIVVNSKGNIIVSDPVSWHFKVIRHGKIVKILKPPKGLRLAYTAISIDDEDNIYVVDPDFIEVLRVDDDSLRVVNLYWLSGKKISNGYEFHPYTWPSYIFTINGDVHIYGHIFGSDEDAIASIKDGVLSLCSVDSLLRDLKEKWNVEELSILGILRIEGNDMIYLSYTKPFVIRVKKRGKGTIDSLLFVPPYDFSRCPPFADKKGRIYVVDGDFDIRTMTGKVILKIYEPEKEE